MAKVNSWIEFELAERKPKTKVWHVMTKDSWAFLGKIAWFGRWRRYSFFPAEGTVFEHQCLEEIRAFLVEETAEHHRKPNHKE